MGLRIIHWFEKRPADFAFRLQSSAASSLVIGSVPSVSADGIPSGDKSIASSKTIFPVLFKLLWNTRPVTTKTPTIILFSIGTVNFVDISEELSARPALGAPGFPAAKTGLILRSSDYHYVRIEWAQCSQSVCRRVTARRTGPGCRQLRRTDATVWDSEECW